MFTLLVTEASLYLLNNVKFSGSFMSFMLVNKKYFELLQKCVELLQKYFELFYSFFQFLSTGFDEALCRLTRIIQNRSQL